MLARTIQIFEPDLFVAKNQRVPTLHEDQITTLKHDLHLVLGNFCWPLPTKALKDIVFRFIIEYSSLRDFGP